MDYRKGVTLIIASYNSEEFILQTLESVASQTRLPDQVIIVDDCSTDNSLHYIKNFMSSNPDIYIKLIKNTKNKGAAYSRNVGIKFSDYEYFCFMDSDDILAARFIEELYNVAIETGVDLTYCDFKMVKTQNNSGLLGLQKIKHLSHSNCKFVELNSKDYLNDYLKYIKPTSFVTFLISKNFYYKYKIFFNESIHYGEDDLFLVSILKHLPSVNYIQCVLYFYIRRSNSITTSQNFVKVKDYILEFDREIHSMYQSKIIDSSTLNQAFIRRLIGVLRMSAKYESDFQHFTEIIEIWKKKINHPLTYSGYKVTILVVLILYFPRLAFMLSKILPG
jgi:glycosyltransferase involved in cell wall biosynthesis